MDCSPPGSSVHGNLQARIREWLAVPSSRGIFPMQGSNPRLFCLPALGGRFIFITRAPGKPIDWTASVIKKQGQQRIHFCHNGIWGYGSSQSVSKQWHHLCWQDTQGSSWRWCRSEQQSPEAGGKVDAISPSYSAGWFYRWFWLLLSPIFSWSPSDSAVNLFSNPRNDSKPFDKFLSSLNQPELISVVCTWKFWH